ncbi:MAG TPA: cysteine desulfurase [Chitinispirillaceae bacterium]|nr:cysteine desulfurase [Chitinispirillaceae bacterium]
MKAFLDVEKIRCDFPILESVIYGKPLVYLDNAATTQKPLSVLDQIKSFYSHWNSNVHRGSHYLSEKASVLYESAREAVRQFIGAKSPQEIIFTSGTTASINLVAQSFGKYNLKTNDEIIITEMEHHSNLVPWQMICKNNGASLRIIPFDDNGMLRIKSIDSIFTDKTKLIALTHVSNVTGVINPVKEIIVAAHARGIPVLLDGAQSVSHQPIDVELLDCDFFVFSGHKMYAETGIGVLYGKTLWLEQMPPTQFGGGMISSVDFNNTTFAEIPFKFEAGTQNFAGAVSIAAAIRYINDIGINEIHSHEQHLLQYAQQRLAEIDGIILYAQSARKSGLLSFNIKNVSPFDAAMILDKMGIAVRSGTHCALPVMKHFGIQGTIRVSLALYNTIGEIDLLVKGVRRARQILQ